MQTVALLNARFKASSFIASLLLGIQESVRASHKMQASKEFGIFDAISECDKNLLVKRYNDLDFTALFLNDELRCVRCKKVAIVHYFSDCDHLYCNICKLALNITLDRKCSQCSKSIVHLETQKASLEIKICLLKVHCPNLKNGCEYEAILAEVAIHSRTCAYSPDILDIWKNKAGARRRVLNILDHQMTMMELQYLFYRQYTVTFVRERISEVNRQLREKTATKAGAVKKVIQQLQKEFETVINPEKLTNSAGKKRTKTVKLQYNNDDRHKLTLFNENFVENGTPIRCMFTPTSTVYTWVINDVQKQNLKFEMVKLFSPEIKINGFPLKVQIGCIFPNAKMWLSLINEHDPRAPVVLNMYPRVTYCINNENVKPGSVFSHLEQVVEYRFLEQFQLFKDQTQQYVCQFGAENFRGAFQNDSITIDLLIDFPHLINMPFSTNGILHWKIQNFSKKMRDSYTGCETRCFSPYFYTGIPGYRMKAELHPSPWCSEELWVKEKRLPLSLFVLAGEYDRELDKEPTFKVELSVLTPHGLHAKEKSDITFTNDDHTLMYLFPVKKMTSWLIDDSLTIEIIVRVGGVTLRI